jgi:hypothetical protein
VLQFAMDSYNGGKFEVTRKGPGEFWEYDLVSAYPFEIAKLYDITWSRVERGAKLRPHALYAFLHVKGTIPFKVHSPVAVSYGGVNVYPVGELHRCITLDEYRYLVSKGADLSIEDGFWLLLDNRQHPYKREIERLVKLKSQYKLEGKALDYHTVKIMLNSLYGKMVQLINTPKGLTASTCWNPIYGAIITAAVRVRVSELQDQYPSVVAVHTDSVLSTSPLPFRETGTLGELSFSTQGSGVILGSGIYQIGKKVRFRGFDSSLDLLGMMDTPERTITITDTRPFTWSEVAFHGWSPSLVNRFTELQKELRVDFDHKRLWLREWKSFREALSRVVDSVPHSELTLTR